MCEEGSHVFFLELVVSHPKCLRGIKEIYYVLPQAKYSFLSLLTINLSYKNNVALSSLLSCCVHENTNNTMDN